MDPVTAAVVAAVAAGALAGATQTASQLVKDAYDRLEGLLSRKYRDVDVTGVERRPNSDAKKESLAEDLDDAGAGGDSELAEAAAAVLEAVRQHAPQVLIGVDVKGLVAAALEISDIESTGNGVRLTDSNIAGHTKIAGVRAGFSGPPDPTAARS
ncbi:hypothetical protein [Nocardia pseudobrasiliensis]|uniref:Uncharacterized protein n=1 Tax=Nocardia pseudobrasiliensis TaxID=45979 RepID=A0A370I044_9NOCA|nr:hypothetical protein [Nocardia pseudobrasiliensis]RDI64125.1 hypothetical protein DFR76_109466 [Nocardia pseudobrasiliensis]